MMSWSTISAFRPIVHSLSKSVNVIEWCFPADTVRRLLLQFLFIFGLGQAITSSFTQHTADLSRDADLRQMRIQERYAFTERFAVAAQRRAYLMSVVIWEVTLHNDSTPMRQEALSKRYEEYRRELIDWNALLKYHEIAISRHFDVTPSTVHCVISRDFLFQNRERVPLDTSILCPISDYRKPDQSLRQILSFLQKDLQATHAIIKKVCDGRLIDGRWPAEQNLQALKAVHPHLNDRVAAYSELLFRLSDSLDAEGH